MVAILPSIHSESEYDPATTDFLRRRTGGFSEHAHCRSKVHAQWVLLLQEQQGGYIGSGFPGKRLILEGNGGGGVGGEAS